MDNFNRSHTFVPMQSFSVCIVNAFIAQLVQHTSQLLRLEKQLTLLDEDTRLRCSKYNFTQLIPSNLCHLLNLREIFERFKQRVGFFSGTALKVITWVGNTVLERYLFFPHSCITLKAKMILLKHATLSHKSRSVNDLWIGIKQTSRKLLR